MAGKTKSATARKPRGKAKNGNGAEQLLEDLSGKLGELASDAAIALKEAGITTKKTAGEAVAHLPVVGNGDKPKTTRKRSTSSSATAKKSSAGTAKASAAKSSTAKSSAAATKSNGKKSSTASTKASSTESSAAKSSSRSKGGSKTGAKSS
jgi:hypothetical protein